MSRCEDMLDRSVGYSLDSEVIIPVSFGEFIRPYNSGEDSYFHLGARFENSILSGIKHNLAFKINSKTMSLDDICSDVLKIEHILNSFEIIREHYKRPKDFREIDSSEILGYDISGNSLEIVRFDDIRKKNPGLLDGSWNYRILAKILDSEYREQDSFVGQKADPEKFTRDALYRCALLNSIAINKYNFNYLDK